MVTAVHVAESETDQLEDLCRAARTHRPYGEEHSTLHPDIWTALRSSPLPRAALPRYCGGLEWDVPRIVEAVRALAMADPSLGWAAAIHAPAGAFIARLEAETALTVCATDDSLPPLIAGSSAPVGSAEATGEHVRLRGTWPLVTSAPEMTMAALAAPDPQDGKTRWWFVPCSAVRVEDDWDAVGLRGSASCSVTCETLVPAGHSVRLTAPARLDLPLYRFPLYGLMSACIAAVAHATADRAVAAFRELTHTTQPRHAHATLAHLAPVQDAYALAVTRLSAAARFADTAVASAWSSALRGPVPDAERAQLRAASSHLSQTAATVCQDLFEAAGSAGVHRANIMESCWRDAAVASRHALVAARGRQLAGAQLLTGTAAGDL
ncbi:hypothetical protein [Streptomyces sp. NBC_01538]|uniref:hypothetical protein n=1 Tax=Streptomyces sp. NBC_01538 TaxID=2903897 RepID=UPI00386D81D3